MRCPLPAAAASLGLLVLLAACTDQPAQDQPAQDQPAQEERAAPSGDAASATPGTAAAASDTATMPGTSTAPNTGTIAPDTTGAGGDRDTAASNAAASNAAASNAAASNAAASNAAASNAAASNAAASNAAASNAAASNAGAAGIDTTGAGPAQIPQERYTTTASGLKYYDLQEGSGASPDASDRVRVHYTGWLQSNGQKFDSSYDRGEPITFALNRVIAGWTEGMQSMQVGGKRQLVIPSELAYGQRGTPDGAIPPGATLVFEVKLLGVEGASGGGGAP